MIWGRRTDAKQNAKQTPKPLAMFLIFDIGGTKTRLASSDGQRVGRLKIIPTPKNFWSGIKAIRDSAHELSGGRKITAVAGGVPGPLDYAKTKILNAPNLSGWNKKPLKATLEKVLGAKVFLENDAALAGLGEAVLGAGKEKKIVAYITVSTGLGGARIVSGKIDENAFGFEPGQQIIQPPDYLEKLVGGRSLEEKFHQKPQQIKDPKIWDKLARELAYGLNNIIVLWSPEIVILGGSMILGKPAIPLTQVRRYLGKSLKIFPKLPALTKAKLGDQAGLYGASVYLRQNLN